MALTQVPIELSSTPGIVDNSNATAITIDSSENVGIGTSSPGATYHLLSGSAAASIHATTNASTGYHEYRYNTSTTAGFLGNGSGLLSGATASDFILRSEAALVFNTNGNNRRVTIDSSGNLLVGGTDTDPGSTGNSANAGTAIGASGYVSVARTGGSAIRAGRIDSDGAIIEFFGDGSLSGSIGTETSNSDLYIGNGDTAIMFHDGADAIFPHNASTNAGRDAAIDIGYSAYRFKDLYLSGQWVSNGSNNTLRASFQVSGTQYGYINVATTGTLYSTSSDYRIKENVVALTNATERLKQLNPLRFSFIPDQENTIVDGFFAHEVADVVPEAIIGAKDAMRDEEYEVTPAVLDDDGNVITEAIMGTRSVPDYQGIDQSKLVPLLVATIQELEARITQLENN